MDSTLKNGINGLLTDKPLLPRVIGFVKASELGTSQKSKDVEDEPEQPQYSLFSRERFLSLFEEASPRRVGRGLQNHGNTCYFNSVLQVLMYTAPLQQFLLSKQHTSECKCKREGTVCTLCLLESHALEAFHSDRAPVKPVKLLRHMPQIASRFKTQGRQEDAHEFLIHFLDACPQYVFHIAPAQSRNSSAHSQHPCQVPQIFIETSSAATSSKASAELSEGLFARLLNFNIRQTFLGLPCSSRADASVIL